MSNKLWSFLILVCFFGGIIFAYYYYFVINFGNLTLKGNVGDYKVILYTDKIKTNFKSDCKNKICELIEIAPFDYELTIKKDGYKEFKQKINLIRKKTLTLDFILEKQINIISLEGSEKKNDESSKDKISQIQEISTIQKTSYKLFDLEELGIFYFMLNDEGMLSLFQKNNNSTTNLYTFEKVEKKYLSVQKIFGDNTKILIGVKDDKYIFDLEKGQITKFLFPQNVNYIKKDNNIYSLITDKGAFLYDENNGNIEFFYLFKDFVFYDKYNYFGIIYSNEIDKKKNYNLGNMENNLIIKYNLKDKKLKVLETTSMNIKKIIKSNNKIYFYDSDNVRYLVDNIE